MRVPRSHGSQHFVDSISHSRVFETILELHGAAKPADVVILFDAIVAKGCIEDIGGAAYLAELYSAAPTAVNAECYARIVRGKAMLRALIRAAHGILAEANAQAMPPDVIVGNAERAILELAGKGVTDTAARGLPTNARHLGD